MRPNSKSGHYSYPKICLGKDKMFTLKKNKIKSSGTWACNLASLYSPFFLSNSCSINSTKLFKFDRFTLRFIHELTSYAALERKLEHSIHYLSRFY